MWKVRKIRNAYLERSPYLPHPFLAYHKSETKPVNSSMNDSKIGIVENQEPASNQIPPSEMESHPPKVFLAKVRK